MPKTRKPRYSEVADQLMFAIAQGNYPLGSSLPSEAQLCERHAVSRHTVREAIRRLEVHGLVTRQQGRGTYVRQAHAVAPVGLLMSTVDEVGRYGRLTRLTNVKMADIEADESLAEFLSCEPGERYIHIQGLRVPRQASDALAKAWSEAWLPERFAALRSELETWQGAIYRLIEDRLGERIETIRQEASAILLPAVVARALGTKAGAAGLRVKRTYTNRLSKPLLVGLNIYAGSEFSLQMELHKAPMNHI